MAAPSPSVLFVGAGLTSSLACSLLQSSLPAASLTVWEKARGAGGRLATSRAPSCPTCTVDLGAQYFSPSPAEAAGEQYRALLAEGLLQPLPLARVEGHRHEEGSHHFTAPRGTSSLVKHFLTSSGASLQCGRRLTELSVEGGRWRARAEGGEEGSYDAVVLTLPVPQLLQLQGDLPTLLTDQGLLADLEKVQYSTRFVLGMFYNSPVDLGVDWAVKYVSSHPMVRYLAVDNLKRGQEGGETSVMVHSSVQWGEQEKEQTLEEAKVKLLEAVKELYPSWPQPKEVKSLKWLYSQVRTGYPGSPGSLLVSPRPSPPLLLAGDAFSHSNFSGCLDSARSLASSLTELFMEQE